MILVLSPQQQQQKQKQKQNKEMKKKMLARNFLLSNLYLKAILKAMNCLWKEESYSLLSHGLKDKTFCRLFSLNAKRLHSK